MALFGWGLGFFGPGVYLVALQAKHGWSAAEISSAITAYYLLAAPMIAVAGIVFERLGTRVVVLDGTVAMGIGVASLGVIDRPWQAYIAFAVMAVGWAAMSNAAINIILAPWFDNRRGRALSLALTGAGVGAIVIVPLLLALIERFSLEVALYTVVALELAILVPAVATTLRPRRAGERDIADGPEASHRSAPAAAVQGPAWDFSAACRSRSAAYDSEIRMLLMEVR